MCVCVRSQCVLTWLPWSGLDLSAQQISTSFYFTVTMRILWGIAVCFNVVYMMNLIIRVYLEFGVTQVHRMEGC